jgi:hypothetical protein
MMDQDVEKLVDQLVSKERTDKVCRACERCGALVQVVDFDLHTTFHSDQDSLFSAVHMQLELINNLIDFADGLDVGKTRRRYYQRENLNTVTKELEVRKQFPNARVYREGA